MTQRRVTATNQISTVIDALQLGKKTGVLTIERGEGETFEEGAMTFLHGQVVKAAIGSYIGRDAVIKLFSWQACRFSFVPLTPEYVSQAAPTTPRPQSGGRVVTNTPRLDSQEVRQIHPNAQSVMNYRPSLTHFYKEAVGDISYLLDQHGLSRIHRRVLLLIDGQRSVGELAILISRSPDEIMTLLIDLERIGLIQL